MKWPCNISVVKVHNFILNSILLDPHFASYPPSAQYQKGFWKWTIENMERSQLASQSEADEFEIDERIYGHYLGLLPTSEPHGVPSDSENQRKKPTLHQRPPSESYVTHYWQAIPARRGTDGLQGPMDLAHYQKVTLFESRRVIESGTTGLRTWRAGCVLAQYLAKHPDLVESKRVLELGCGIGFMGAVTAAIQIRHWTEDNDNGYQYGSLYLTDVNDDVLSRCRDNLRLACNSSSSHPDIHVQTLDWFASLDSYRERALVSLLDNEIKPNIVLGADIVFDPSLIPALTGVLKLVVSNSTGSTHALIALTVRNETTVNSFMAHVREASLQITEVLVGDTLTESVNVSPAQDEEKVKLFRITE
ncbi:hypothetical protein P691DRAFT_777095 [Macrolepiota fuliginosa MF-IS2]|uniref:Uncharacterized protein n=1 Tax=Macrolepiota fuliginosa MF-IS2 TaxID=1400762 RepID=A0A9P6C1Y3_9AGAR|nr:hypothetical protein P691DRAFT_777095 [Macrolepiota fuliginosa MF-IS2]